MGPSKKKTVMKTVSRILKIHEVEGYKVFCLFDTEESRVIDFEKIYKSWGVGTEDIEYPLASNITEFKKVKLVDGTLMWENIKILDLDEAGNTIELPYDLDPIVLYENSEVDESRQIEIGMLIKKSRTELGLTQEELARKSGTTKHYISRVENNRTEIEISTLKKLSRVDWANG